MHMRLNAFVAAYWLVLLPALVLLWRVIAAFRSLRSELRANEPALEDLKLPKRRLQEYKDDVARSKERYSKSMAEYDRLMPWASGGALVLSMSFVGAVYKDTSPDAVLLLIVAWTYLVLSLISTILSQYFSTRIQVSYQEYRKLRLLEPRPTSKEFEKSNAKTLKARASRILNGNRTKFLNETSAILLILGVVTFGVFVLFALPFGQNLPLR